MRMGREKLTEMIRKQRSFVSHSFGLTTEKTDHDLKVEVSVVGSDK